MKKSTEIVAKRNSCCPLCMLLIRKGDRAKVYNNGWYHPACFEEVFIAIQKRRELQYNGVK